MNASQGIRQGSILFALALLSEISYTQEPKHILTYVSCIADARVLGKTYAGMGAMDRAKPIFDEARQCLDAELPLAVADAGDNADLRTAVKDFYVAATVWLNASASQRTEPQFDAALTRVRMEAKAAQKWD